MNEKNKRYFIVFAAAMAIGFAVGVWAVFVAYPYVPGRYSF